MRPSLHCIRYATSSSSLRCSLRSLERVYRLAITAYKDGNAPALQAASALDLEALDEALEQLLAIPPLKDEVAAKYKQPYAFFSPDGRRLELLSEMANSVVFLFEGGQFIWPGVKVGHKSTSSSFGHDGCTR